jgi:hypothetical protein
VPPADCSTSSSASPPDRTSTPSTSSSSIAVRASSSLSNCVTSTSAASASACCSIAGTMAESSETTPIRVVSLPELSATWSARTPISTTMITIELMMKFLSRRRAEISRAATSRTSAVLLNGRGSVMPPPPRGS